MDDELALADRPVQLLHRLQPAAGGLEEVLRPDGRPTAAAGLGHVHRGVGVAEHLLDGLAGRGHRDPDAGRQGDLAAGDADR
jgi:hypothetical protein